MSGPLAAEHFPLELMLDGLGAWAAVESPTTEPAAVNRMMDLAELEMRLLEAEVVRHPGRDGFGDTLVARLPWAGERVPGILVLAHLDTVHALGTAAERLPIRIEEGRLYGPGVYDMKGGTYCAVRAAAAVLEADGATSLPVTFMFVPDEEFGSPTSRELIEAEARGHRYVLVPEPAQEEGDLITGRWAFQRFVMHARGRPAHAGATLARGRSAIRELAEQVIRVEALSEPERHVTLSVGVLRGGTFVNVVPEHASAEVLAVTPTQADFDAVRAKVLALGPIDPAVSFEVVPGPVRPLYTETDDVLTLYERARALAREVGYEPGRGEVGGGSDGNFTGALGITTLDGLGLCGDGFHTHSEHVEIDSIVPRTRVLSGLLRSLD